MRVSQFGSIYSSRKHLTDARYSANSSWWKLFKFILADMPDNFRTGRNEPLLLSLSLQMTGINILCEPLLPPRQLANLASSSRASWVNLFSNFLVYSHMWKDISRGVHSNFVMHARWSQVLRLPCARQRLSVPCFLVACSVGLSFIYRQTEKKWFINNKNQNIWNLSSEMKVKMKDWIF